MRKAAGMLALVGFGAGLAYLFDPEAGRRRRSRLRDRVVHSASEVGESKDRTLQDLKNRIEGVAATLRSRQATPSTDRVLLERVRSRLGHIASHPRSLLVSAAGGVVTLAGPILASEVEATLAATVAISGVRGIENRLDVHESAEGVPGLQGARPQNCLPSLAAYRWSPTTRLLAGVTSASLLAGYLTGRRGPWSKLFGAVGLGLGTRSLINTPLTHLLGTEGRRVVPVEKTIHIKAPVEDVFSLFSKPEAFPRFMEHIKGVRRLSRGLYRWEALGPLGAIVSWDSIATQVVPGELVKWESLPGSEIGNEGFVRFISENASTRVDIRMAYNPPLGLLGHLFATLTGVDPKHALEDDLVRLKSLLEDGHTSAHGAEVTRQEVETS